MNKFTLSTLLIAIISVTASNFVLAQIYSPYSGTYNIAKFNGISPYIGKAPGMDKGEYEVNIIPFTRMQVATYRFDFRVNSYINIFYKTLDQRGISSYGIDFGPVIYFKEKLDREMPPPTSFFIAPVLRGFFYPHNKEGVVFDLSFLIEPGYHIAVSDRVSVMVSMEMGYKYGMGIMEEENPWRFHFLPRVMAGIWLNI